MTSNKPRKVNKMSNFTKRLLIGIGFIPAAVLLSSCKVGTSNVLGFGFSQGITPQAHMIRNFWTWACILALAVGCLVWFLTLWAIVFHKKKKNSPDFPPQVGYNMTIEGMYTIIPVIVVLALFWVTIVVQDKLDEIKPNPGVVVDVTAFKWNWKFGYAHIDMDGINYNGLIDPKNPSNPDPFKGMSADAIERYRESFLLEKQTDGSNISLAQLHLDKIETLGTTSEIPVLVLPTNTRIEFRIASADVVHSFYVPEFLFKRDAFPFPLANHSNFRFQISKIDKAGSFVGRCSQMCGNFHSAMNFEVLSVSPKDFLAYIKARQDGDTASQALTAIGQPDHATVTEPFNS